MCVCVDKSITTMFKKGVYVCVLRGVLRMDVSSFFSVYTVVKGTGPRDLMRLKVISLEKILMSRAHKRSLQIFKVLLYILIPFLKEFSGTSKNHA